MTMLHHHTQGDPNATPIILIHGLFGDGQNLLGLAKGLTDYFVIMPDCRNHGQSFHHYDMSYPTMANDIINLMNDYQCSNPIVIGHSMGGKIAMALALQHPNMIRKLVVMDIAPKQYPPHHLSIIQALQQLNLASFTSKTEAITALAPSIPNAGLRQFLAKTLPESIVNFAGKSTYRPLLSNTTSFQASQRLATQPTAPPYLLKGINPIILTPKMSLRF